MSGEAAGQPNCDSKVDTSELHLKSTWRLVGSSRMNGGLGWDGGTGREGSAEKMRSWVRRGCVRTQSLQSCLTLGDATDCSPPGSSSVHGILQARIVEWVTVTSSRGSS